MDCVGDNMRYHNITKTDLLNGAGIRVVLWVAGCNHYCEGCHNKQTWDPTDGLLFDEEAVQELFAALDKDYIKGITFSGGDPLFPANRETIMSLIARIKRKYQDTKDIWLYTGYKYEEVADYVNDVDVLVDGPFIRALADKQYHWAGSTNQRVIDVKQTKKQGRIVLYADH